MACASAHPRPSRLGPVGSTRLANRFAVEARPAVPVADDIPGLLPRGEQALLVTRKHESWSLLHLRDKVICEAHISPGGRPVRRCPSFRTVTAEDHRNRSEENRKVHGQASVPDVPEIV